MSKVLFAKYNRNRRKEFQIGTTLYEDTGKRYAKKVALTMEAQQHIKHMQESCMQMQGLYENLTLLEGNYNGKDEMIFDFIEGRTVTDVLLDAAAGKDKDVFLKEIKSLVDRIFCSQCQMQAFEITAEFKEVFGNIIMDAKTLPITNVDLIFDNIVEKDGKYICIDYEWTFSFPVPVDFVYYRSIHYFYSRNVKHLGTLFQERELLHACGIEEEKIPEFESMESSFQKWVFGDADYCLRYVKDSESRILQNYKSMQERILQLQEEEEDRNRHIAYLDGMVALLQEKFAEKDMISHAQEARISELENLCAAKDGHISNIQVGYHRWMMLTSPLRFGIRIGRGIVRRGKSFLAEKKREKICFPFCEQPLVSIIIPVYNQFEYTYNCLKSIYENTEDVPYEIIIGDDLSTDKTVHLDRYVNGIKIIRNEENLRFLKNCNQAAKQARGKYLLFLNNDTMVSKGWLSSLVTLIESDDKIGMVGSKLIYPDGRLQEAGGIIWRDASAWNYGNGQDAYLPQFNYVRETDYISGASIMIRHELWKEIGGFDERFAPAYCEDSDLAFEIRKHGYKVMYQPKSVVTHFEGVSNGTDTSSGLKKYQVENGEKLREKWKKELAEHYANGTDVFCARERNYGKKVVLVIDHYVPTYDKDAGSKTTFQYIKMFLKKGFVVKFIGDNFASMEPYTSVLQQMGVEVLYGPWYAQHVLEWIEENQQYISVAYLNRPHISEKYIHFLKYKTNIKIIYYGHDLCFLRERREAELTGDEELLKSSENWKSRELNIMQEADMSYYPSAVEVEAIHELNSNISVKAITAYIFENFKTDCIYNSEKRKGLLFVGGFSHKPNIDAVEWFVREIFPLIRRKEEIPFYIVGSNAPKEIQQLSGEGIVFKGFLSEEELQEMYEMARIVVVPLRYGAGIKGKVIEALYNGVPVVTTDIGAEGIIGIEDIAEIGNSPEEMAEKILSLYCDSKHLEDLAEKSRDYVREHFSMDAAWNVIEKDFM